MLSLLAAALLAAAPATDAARTALDAINLARAHVHLSPVALDDKLSKACRAHADYLRRNHGRPEVAGLKAHHEEPGLPGYSKAGDQAGKSSDIAYVAPPAAVAQWVNSLYHRTPILRPKLARVGIGSAAGPKGPISVLMFDESADDESAYPILYPADGQSGVPLTFTGEIPDPVPAGQPQGGSPITLAFGSLDVGSVRAHVLDSSGEDVPVHLSTPSHPATSFPQGGVVCLIPKRPLHASATYRVSVDATVAGKNHEYRWSFTTARPLEVEAGNAAELEKATEELVLLTGDVRQAGKIGGYSFLQVGEAGASLVSIFIPDAAWPAFEKAGVHDVATWSGKRVQALGILHRSDPKNIGVEISEPSDLHIVEVKTPVVDADSPSVEDSVGKLVRLRGRVRHTGKVGAFVFLNFGESRGHMVSAWIPAKSWPRFKLDLSTLAGRSVTVRGVLRFQEQKYLNVSVEEPDQLGWSTQGRDE